MLTYAVKLQGNPQATRVLANDFLACRIAQLIGLRVPQVAIISRSMKHLSETSRSHLPLEEARLCPSRERNSAHAGSPTGVR